MKSLYSNKFTLKDLEDYIRLISSQDKREFIIYTTSQAAMEEFDRAMKEKAKKYLDEEESI